MCGSPVTAEELDLAFDVMHGCFTEGDDSILGVFSWELLRAKLQHRMCTCALVFEPAALCRNMAMASEIFPWNKFSRSKNN